MYMFLGLSFQNHLGPSVKYEQRKKKSFLGFLFVYLAVSHSVWDLSSLTRAQTLVQSAWSCMVHDLHVPSSGSAESQPPGKSQRASG